MSQRELLKKLVIDFCNQQGSRTFSLQELHKVYGDYSVIGVGGETPQATVRRLLQELRDSEFISFLEKSGHYTLRAIDFLDAELAEIEKLDISKESPEKREYLVETYVRNVKWVSEAKKVLGTQCLCSGCNNRFKMDDGVQYIEVHHIIPLCKGGEDGLWNLSVLCAHHHRMAHFAETDERIKMEKYLLKEVSVRI